MASERVQELLTSCQSQIRAIKESLTVDEEKDDNRSNMISFLRFCRENLLLLLLFLSLFLGVLIGLIISVASDKEYSKQEIAYISFPGTLFVNALKMAIIPLIVSSLIAGMASLDKQASGKLGGKAILFYFSTTCIAVVLGVIMVSMIRPGYTGPAKDDIKRTDRDIPQVNTLDAIMDLIR